jgi:uncharacterized protein YciI
MLPSVHFMIFAWDRPDDEGVARRDATRAAHGETITALFEAGRVLFGAGVFDDEGVVRGSLIIADYPTRAEVDAYLAGEPFATAGVWDRVEVHPLRVPSMYLSP